ncbi:hypothetical protein KIL84_015151 [Mauremys mutica]|uniref:Uncharacterized protein n=1 Tax=Mauremys mutica TaxID=74926 RepID=A0A9D3WQ72_9SAUR|nr:hypothetical protein KIL84_015151 [Mauremys mutica]
MFHIVPLRLTITVYCDPAILKCLWFKTLSSDCSYYAYAEKILERTIKTFAQGHSPVSSCVQLFNISISIQQNAIINRCLLVHNYVVKNQIYIFHFKAKSF